MEQIAYYPIPNGYLKIGYESESITGIKIVSSSDTEHCPSPVSDLAARQIHEYLNGSRTAFDFPVSLRGTPFQRLVWQEICRIPYGETRTYGQIAASIGKSTAARTVGRACNKNPVWIVVPCHRVIGRGNALIGYAGGLERKQFLLNLEQSTH